MSENFITNNPIVSIEELNQVLNFTPTEEGIIEINFSNDIVKFDIVFIAGLFLLHKTKKRKFKIVKAIIINQKRIWEARQYIAHYIKLNNLKFGDVFVDIKFLNIEYKKKDDSKKKIDNTFISRDFNQSRSFAPIFFINKETIKDFFELSKVLPNELSNLADKYLMRQKDKRNKIEEKYLASDKSVFTKMNDHSIINTFIFYILYNKISPFVTPESKEIEDPIERTNELWKFTKEYINGLHELAKNIVEHSGPNSNEGVGMITIRVYDDDENDFNPGKVLETHVFDFGEKGIIEKLKKFTEENKNMHKFLEKDLETLNNDFTLLDFIEPKIEKQLHQQISRDISHFGLMKFYQLIKVNEGSILSATNSTSEEIQDIYRKDNGGRPIAKGTSYFFKLPFKHKLFKSVQATSASTNYQGTSETIGGITEIMKLKITDNLEDIKDNTILVIDFPKIVIRNRDDEANLLRGIDEKLNFDNLQKQKVRYIAFNMGNDKLNVSESSLLRFLAHLSINYDQSIIIYNMDYVSYDKMIKDNTTFYERVKTYYDNIPYWYKNKAILFYTSIEDRKFYFADLLFGQEENEFNAINKIIHHTFPNTRSLTKKTNDYNDFQVPENLDSYFFQSSLLPFDILLPIEEGYTAFQTNLVTLLDTEITAINKEDSNE